MSLISYSYKALAQNEFTSSLVFTCQVGQQCYANGSDVISAFSLGVPTLWYCILINFVLVRLFFEWVLILCVGIMVLFVWNGYFSQDFGSTSKIKVIRVCQSDTLQELDLFNRHDFILSENRINKK